MGSGDIDAGLRLEITDHVGQLRRRSEIFEDIGLDAIVR